MPAIYPAMVPVRAEIWLDLTDSAGSPTHPMDPKLWRPMALTRRDGELWYGFVINDAAIKSIAPGTTVTCDVSFLNHEDATAAIPRGASVLIGDGFVTRGVLRIA